jgi:SAM-dependent methyltransferase
MDTAVSSPHPSINDVHHPFPLQIPYPEDFDDLKLPEGSVDTIISTYMWCKRKDPYKTFEKAMRLLKDGGAFVFVEPILGEGPVAGVRRYFGQVHRATNAFGDPSLDIKVRGLWGTDGRMG